MTTLVARGQVYWIVSAQWISLETALTISLARHLQTLAAMPWFLMVSGERRAPPASAITSLGFMALIPLSLEQTSEISLSKAQTASFRGGSSRLPLFPLQGSNSA